MMRNYPDMSADSDLNGVLRLGRYPRSIVGKRSAIRLDVLILITMALAMTGAPLHGQEFALVPISASGGHSILGNEIILAGAGQRVFLEITISGWDPNLDNFPLLRACQTSIDSSGYGSGAHGVLVPADVDCAGDGDCSSALGIGSLCGQSGAPAGKCMAGFIDEMRVDYVFAFVPNFHNVDLYSLDYAYAAVTLATSIADEGTAKYLGTLVLDVPANTFGTFTIGFDAGQSAMQDQDTVPITPLSFVAAQITVQCLSDNDCDDSNACTTDVCEGDMSCSNTNNFDDATFCCNPADGTLTVIDDGNECSDDLCDPDTGQVSHPPGPLGIACGDSSDTECTDPDTCDGSGACDDNHEAAGTVCRTSTGLCDPAEVCDGFSGTCPPDVIEPEGTECRASTGLCDPAEVCDDLSGACPFDEFYPLGVYCGDDPTDCSDYDICDGAGTCDPNDFPDGTPCEDGNPCTETDECLTGVCSGSIIPGCIIYVDASATGNDDGSNWTDAYNNLQDALANADETPGSVDQIWVANGTYMPDGGYIPNGGTHVAGSGDRTAVFQLINDVAIYGGFSGVESSLNERNTALNEARLSGDLSGDDAAVSCTQHSPDCVSYGNLCIAGHCIIKQNNGDNSYHVLVGNGTDATAVLNGFTITGGNANGSSPHDLGGGMHNSTGSPTVTNCTFTGNTAGNGGGMYNRFGASPTVINCALTENAARAAGGGMYNYSAANATVTNCTFSVNWGEWYGGGMHNDNSNPTVTNCTFSENLINAAGCGMRNNFNSNPTVTNCIFWGHAGGEISDYQSTPIITYSDVHGGYPGTGNIDADPYFFDSTDGDLRLNCYSPCVDAGNNASVPGGITTDMDGNARFMDDTGVFDTGAGTPPIVDMGAYERQIQSLGTLYVDAARCPGQGLGTPDDPFCSIQDAIDSAGFAKHTIEVAPGLYNEAIDFSGKALTVTSTGGRDVTFIDATGLATSVVSCASGEGTDAVLDGFTLTGGTGTDPGDGYLRGGGIYIDASSPTVTNCTLTANTGTFGAGMYNGGGSPTVTNCTFSLNSGHSGGGMFNDGGSPVVSNCIFRNNGVHGPGSSGGGMYNQAGSTPAVTNCEFYSNWGGYGGGGMRNESADPTVTNCTFNGNHGIDWGRAISNIGSNPTLTNCILWGNTGDGGEIYNSGSSPTVTYSNVEGGTGQSWFGTGCIDANPLFRNVSTGDLRLQPGSPCVDTGDDTAVPLDMLDVDSDGDISEPTPDLYDKPRIIDGDGDTTRTVDMGAYEYYVDCNGNEIPDVCDVDCSALGGTCNVPGCGLSSECNTNGIPDDCDIAGCTSGSPDYPGCDDCNLNRVPDECDIAGSTSDDVNLDEVPDECIRPYTGGVDWSDSIWHPASDDYPDNHPGNPNGIPDQHVVLAAVDLLLDVTVEIDTLTVESDASLCMNAGSPCTTGARRNHNRWDEPGAELAVAGTGDLMLADAGGLQIEGTLRIRTDRTITESAEDLGATMTLAKDGQVIVQNSTITLSGDMIIKESGRYTDDPSQLETNTASLSTRSVMISGAECAFGAFCATLELIESMSLTVSEGLTVAGLRDFMGFSPGSVTVADHAAQRSLWTHACPGTGLVAARVGVTPPPCFAVTGFSSAGVSGHLMLSDAVITINESPDNGIRLTGNFANHGTYPSLFNWNTGRLAMIGSTSQSFEVAGIDFGQSQEGFQTNEDTLFDTEEHGNFSIGLMEIGSADAPATVRFVNEFANTVAAGPCGEALYVDVIRSHGASTVVLENSRVYYNVFEGAEEGVTITEIGCGEILPVCVSASAPQQATLFTTGQDDRKSRFLSVLAGDPGRNQGVRVIWDAMPDWPGGHAALVGQQKFMMQPFQVCENSGQGLATWPPNCGPSPGQPQQWFWAADMTCNDSAAWFGDLFDLRNYCSGSGQPCTTDADCVQGTCGVDGVVHLRDLAIAPSRVSAGVLDQAATYTIQTIDATCLLALDGNYSDALVVTNAGWGDPTGLPGPCPAAVPNNSPDLIGDVTETIRKFSNLNCAPKKTRVDMDQDLLINFPTDVLMVLNAYSNGGGGFTASAGPACAATVFGVSTPGRARAIHAREEYGLPKSSYP